MKPHSIEFRQKIIEIHEKENISIRQLAQRFCVAKSFIQKLIKQHKKQEIFILNLKGEFPNLSSTKSN